MKSKPRLQNLEIAMLYREASTYQFRDFVKGKFFCFVGTWAMAMTSLKDRI